METATPTVKPRILVVDDQVDVCRSVADVLRDEGYEVDVATDGREALALLRERAAAGTPLNGVLLDIWLPGTDGLQVLSEVRSQFPTMPVVMMSGHATIGMALGAIKAGAVDFLEKPLDITKLVTTVERIVEQGSAAHGSAVATIDPAERSLTEQHASGLLPLESLVFPNTQALGAVAPQRTLRRSIILYGTGLHSGTKSGLVLEPLPANSGIHFTTVSRDEVVPAHVSRVSSTGFATTLTKGESAFSTIEHLMSAFCAYGITNVLVKCEGEVPVFDGSSREYCRLFNEVGIVDQSEPVHAIKIDRTLRVDGRGGEFIEISPGPGLIIDYTLRYPAPVGEQHFVFTLRDAQGAMLSSEYRDQIAPCRTFGFVKDIGFLQKQGYAQGGRFDNFVLFGPEGAINDSLRFPDEPTRHKILDAIGDLYLLGRPLEGRIRASMTGHSDNIALLRLIASTYGL